MAAAVVNNLNELTAVSGSGMMTFAGTLQDPAPVTINGNQASVNASLAFTGTAPLTVGTNYCYTFDHLGSIRELTDATGAVQARYDYDSYGDRTQLSGTMLAEFGYAGYYQHVPSGLHLTLFRAYNRAFGTK